MLITIKRLWAPLTCVAGTLLWFGCAVRTSDVRTADTADTDSDSDDYSAWFEGMSQADIDDFDKQFDADQLAYPTEVAEPDHDPEPSDVARVGFGGARARAELASIAAGTGSGSDSLDAGTGSGSDGGGSGSDGGTGSGATCGSGSGSVTVGATASLDAAFNAAVRDQYIGTFGPVRDHNIFARGSASGTAHLTLSGSLTGTANSWTATISVNGRADVTVWVHADQELVGRFRRGWFAIGDATLSGSATFADSVTFTQSCNPPGVVATTPGTPAVTVNVTVDDVRFYGYFFPRLQGPIAQRVRGAIAQFARNFANRQLPGLIGPSVFRFNQAYAAKKMELLGRLVAALPPGCGCALSTSN